MARIYVRGIEGDIRNLYEERSERRSAPRVIKAGSGKQRGFDASGGDFWLMGPDSEPFLSQSLQSHLVVVEPGGRNEGHGHQNEALFYILEGRGYELHDGLRYDWEAGDVVVVHNDSVHWHNNLNTDKPAVAIVIKAKAQWLFLGMGFQARLGWKPPQDDQYGPREEWIVARQPGDAALKKVLKPTDTPWQLSPQGNIRLLSDETVPLRNRSVDAYQQEIPGGSHSGQHWHMADELLYVLKGQGYDLHWDVEVEIDDKYYARVAKEPTRHEWAEGDMVWIPQNTVHQHFNGDPNNPAVFISAQNRMFKHLGYRNVVQLEAAPEYLARVAGREPAAVR